jgi:hypothetical protein
MAQNEIAAKFTQIAIWDVVANGVRAGAASIKKSEKRPAIGN